MPATLDGRLVVAISSRALFDLEESNQIFVNEGVARYTEYQLKNENVPLGPGVAFTLIKRLLQLRYPDTGQEDTGQEVAEVVLVSQNDANTGLRIFNSIEHHGLPITRAAFTRGRPVSPYLTAFKTDLFLSASQPDVAAALKGGHAAARIFSGATPAGWDTGCGSAATDEEAEADSQIRIAFDGDAVLFSDEAEQVYQSGGLEAFAEHEREKADIPLKPGPFKAFLEALTRIQRAFEPTGAMPIRTALVTARNAPAHKRAIKTFRHWGIGVDEAFFLGGLSKSPVLGAFRPHIFFDDQTKYCEAAAKVVPTGHVPVGANNHRD